MARSDSHDKPLRLQHPSRSKSSGKAPRSRKHRRRQAQDCPIAASQRQDRNEKLCQRPGRRSGFPDGTRRQHPSHGAASGLGSWWPVDSDHNPTLGRPKGTGSMNDWESPSQSASRIIHDRLQVVVPSTRDQTDSPADGGNSNSSHHDDHRAPAKGPARASQARLGAGPMPKPRVALGPYSSRAEPGCFVPSSLPGAPAVRKGRPSCVGR